ncbi:hypothetical protein Fmac_027855 [Flemingia macrophylla]|uniref:Uncharacterized protein n=1 Tax=Flemingia macrophylla TaxID=520843 RepID=A0ABD1LJ25_9FABA
MEANVWLLRNLQKKKKVSLGVGGVISGVNGMCMPAFQLPKKHVVCYLSFLESLLVGTCLVTFSFARNLLGDLVLLFWNHIYRVTSSPGRTSLA